MIKSQATPKEVIMDDPVALVLFKPESISTLKDFSWWSMCFLLYSQLVLGWEEHDVGLLLEKSQAVD